MKAKCLSLFFLMAICMCVSSGYAKIDPGVIVGIWLFNEGKGEIITDSSGNGHDGEIQGKDVKGVDGKFGKALSFPGTTSGVVIPHEESLNLTTFTVTVWFKVEEDTGDYQGIMNKVSGDTSQRNYGIVIDAESKAPYANFTHGASGWRSAVAKTPVIDGKWHSVAGSYDGKTLRAYVDGSLEAELGSEAPDIIDSPILIGTFSLENAGRPMAFKGIIDDVGLFNKALPEDEIRSIMTKGIAGASAVEPAKKLSTTWGAIKAKYYSIH